MIQRVANKSMMDQDPCLVKPRDVAPKKANKPKFSIVQAGAFASEPLPGWVIKGLLPEAELAVVYGESTAGKSFVLIDMMSAIARGDNWRGIEVKQRRVVYVCAEGKVGFRKRLRAYGQYHGVDMNTIPFGVISDPPNLLKQDDKAIAERVNAWGGADIIVFDTLAQSTPGGNENTSESIGTALEHCKRLHDVTGALIILVAHTGKDASKGVRGWSGIKGATDVQIEVVRDGDRRAIKVNKQKDDQDGDEFGFRLGVVVIGYDNHGNAVTSCVVEHVSTVPSTEPKKKHLSVKQKLVLATAQSLLGVSKDPVSRSDLLEACVSRISRNEYGKCDNRRRDLTRAFEALEDANLINTSSGYVNLR